MAETLIDKQLVSKEFRNYEFVMKVEGEPQSDSRSRTEKHKNWYIMMVNFLSWNARGLGLNKEIKRKPERSLVHQWGVGIYVLMETKTGGGEP